MFKLYPGFLVCFTLLSYTCIAQPIGPNILWQKCFGGTGDEKANSITSTPSGGFVICGTSTSNDGDVTGHHGTTSTTDAWVVAVAADGTLLWQKSIGGSGADELDRIIPASDGGYIAIGTTSSNDGDVSGGNTTYGMMWVVKLDGSGNLQWQKCLGGNQGAIGTSICQTPDGGYMAIGSTYSTSGGVTGNHGQEDAWLVRLDVSGNVKWQKCIGGSLRDAGNDVTPMANNEYLLALNGESGYSPGDGDFTGLMSGNGPLAYRFVVDSLGNKLRATGGLQRDEAYGAVAINNNAYITIVRSLNCYPANQNYGVNVGLADSNFNSNFSLPPGSGWGAAYSYCLGVGVNASNYGYRVFGGGAVIALSNGTGVIGLTTDDTAQLNHHGVTTAFRTTDAFLGGVGPVPAWKKCYGGTNSDGFNGLARVDDYTFLAAGWTNSTDGDVSGNHGGYDFWIVKLSNVNVVRGTVYMDYNLNGVKDANEPGVSNLLVQSSKTGVRSGSLTNNGAFYNTVDTGTYTTGLLSALPSYYTATPSSHTSSFISYNNTDSFGIALQPILNQRDYRLNVGSIFPARPGQNEIYILSYSNLGTDTLQNRVVTMVKDHRSSFVSATQTPLFISGDTIRWNIASLSPRDAGSITVTLLLATPPTLSITDTLVTTATIDTTGDLNPQNNTGILKQIVSDSYDPNEKSEADEGLVYVDDLAKGKYLQYTINFQNTGNDTAFSITVADTLSSKLDIPTFEMVATSAPYQLTVKNGNALSWSFPGINLLDSGASQPGSQGYIIYRIKPVSTVHAGDSVHNTASIYFDLNPPVVTNLQVTYIQNRPNVPPPPQPVITGLQTAYCKNPGAAVFIMTNFPDTTGGMTVVTDTIDQTPLLIGSGASCSIQLSGLTPGTHTVKVTYTNPAGSSNVMQTFNVVAASTPMVGLNANFTTIPNTVASVIVTATGVSVGSTPLYTFSLNRGFSPAIGGPGATNLVAIDTSALAVGPNTVYVRVLSSDTCVTAATAVDSIVVTRTAPSSGGGGTVTAPAHPVIAGLNATYCTNAGTANVTLSNPPDNNTTVSVTLDGAALTSGASGNYTITLAGLSAGTHIVKATYTNTAGTSSETKTFTVEAVGPPIVAAYANYSIIPVSVGSVIVSALPVLNGGSTPVFTFSMNRNFSPVLSGPGTANSVVIDTAALAIGPNTVYVQMLSSDTCVTSPTTVNSVVVTRMAPIAGVSSNDSSSLSIGANPNPFRDRLIVTGLVATHGYTITLLNGEGMEIGKVRVSGATTTQLTPGPVTATGIYLLRVYDETQGKVIRLVRLLGMGND